MAPKPSKVGDFMFRLPQIPPMRGRETYISLVSLRRWVFGAITGLNHFRINELCYTRPFGGTGVTTSS